MSNTSSFPKISVVTFVKNGAATLEKAILSVIQQNYPNLEFIVLDAASKDGTLDIVHRYEKNIFYWRSFADGGSVPATNEGWRKATGDVIALLAADDWFEPGAFAAVAEAFIGDPSLEVVTGGVRIVRHEANRDCIITYGDEKFLNLSVASVLYPTVTHAHFVRRKIYEELDGYDERFLTSADLDFLLRLALRGVRGKVLERVVYNFLQHPGSNSMGGDWRKLGVMAWDNMRVIEQHLNAPALPSQYKSQLRAFHGVYAMRAIYVAVKGLNFEELLRALDRAFGVNPGWPARLVKWMVGGLRKRIERRQLTTYVTNKSAGCD